MPQLNKYVTTCACREILKTNEQCVNFLWSMHTEECVEECVEVCVEVCVELKPQVFSLSEESSGNQDTMDSQE